MSFTAESRERSRPALPLAGMVDVLFLLLIFFMTASVFRDQELQMPVALPTSDTAQLNTAAGTQIIVTLSGDDQIFLGDRQVDLPELLALLRELAQVFPDETVVVRGDKASSFGLAVRIMDLAQQAGLRNVSVATVKSVDEIQ